MIHTAVALTCEFSGWDVPELSDDGTIMIDGEPWTAQDSHNNKEYTRVIVKNAMNGVAPQLDSSIADQTYLSLANDFLERNDGTLNIADYGKLTIRDVEIPKTIDFLGKSQYCYNVPIVGTFAGALAFTNSQIYAITSKWYAPVVIESVEPGLSPDDIGIDDAEIKILPVNDEFVLVYEVDDEGKKEYYDANNGKKINPPGQKSRDEKLQIRMKLDGYAILLILLISFLVVISVAYITYFRKKS